MSDAKAIASNHINPMEPQDNDIDDQSDTQSVAPQDSNIKIFLRIKPTKRVSGYFECDEDSSIIKYEIPRDTDAGLINNSRTSYKFKFDAVIGMTAKQDEVFDKIGKPCVTNALNGFNSTVFAYGQTGSGKTFTITGGAERYDDRGLIPRALSMIFDVYKNDASRQLVLHISYLEIYNGLGYDLLDPNHETTKSLEDLPKVTMLEDEFGNCHLRNLSMHPINAEEEALNLLFLGDTNRAVSETTMNLASSRSHCIFTVSIESRKAGSEVVLRSKLHLVDLAGSERAHKTGAKGQVLKEAAHINTSLHYLEMVIVALQEKHTKGRAHIPYRNSMMTSVLRDSLGGNCKTVMVATVSAEKDQTDESVSTCRFAQRVARVQNDARLNEEVDPAVIIRQLNARIAELEEELAILRGNTGSEEALKDYDKDKLRQKCIDYATSKDPSAQLLLGEFSYIKMKLCFQYLKDLIQSDGSSSQICPSSKVRKDPYASDNQQSVLTEEARDSRIQELEQTLLQRDNEIAIMVAMLKKQPGTVLPAEISKSSMQHKSPPPAVVDNSFLGTFRVDIQTLEDPVKSFEAFKLAYPKSDAIRSNKDLLRIKYDQAKSLASNVNAARSKIKDLTQKMEKLRTNRLITQEGLMVGDRKAEMSKHTDEGIDIETSMSKEEKECKTEMDEFKALYKKGFNDLSELKKEIQHIQKILEVSRIKLQKDFDLWYQRQGKGTHLTESILQQSQSQMQAGSTSNNWQESERMQSARKSKVRNEPPESPFSGRSESKCMEADRKSAQKDDRRSSITSTVSTATTSSTVDEDVSGFYEALEILKRRGNRK